MSPQRFNSLPLAGRAKYLLSNGQMVAQKPEENGMVVSFYKLHGFFVEVHFNKKKNEFFLVQGLITDEDLAGFLDSPASSLL